jgi:hypothetical protein
LFNREIFPRQIPRRVKLFRFIGAGLKSSLNFSLAGEIETVPPGRASLAAAPEVINSPAPFAQGAKRILFNARAVFILVVLIIVISKWPAR